MNPDAKLESARQVDGMVFWLRFDDGLEGELDLRETFLSTRSGLWPPLDYIKDFQSDEKSNSIIWRGGSVVDWSALYKDLWHKVVFSDTKYCPECGSEKMIEIVYGLPSPGLFDRAARGEVHLGGCIVSGSDPGWACEDCGVSFRFPRTTKPVK